MDEAMQAMQPDPHLLAASLRQADLPLSPHKRGLRHRVEHRRERLAIAITLALALALAQAVLCGH